MIERMRIDLFLSYKTNSATSNLPQIPQDLTEAPCAVRTLPPEKILQQVKD